MKTGFKNMHICASPFSDKARDCGIELTRRLEKQGIRVSPRFSPEVDLVLVLGGDGYMLDVIHRLDFPDVPLWGFNFGQVGLLMNNVRDADKILDVLNSKEFRISEYPLLQADVLYRNGKRKKIHAFNEISAERLGCQNIRLDCHIDGNLLNRFSGDGLIIATPTGSTAYSFAAGGSVVHATVPAILLTPVNPHRPVQFHSLQFPVVLPEKTVIEITVCEHHKRRARLMTDGKDLGSIRRITVTGSERKMKLVKVSSYCFTSALLNKIIGGAESV